MRTYASLVDVAGQEFQNVQELASLWGEIRGDLEQFDVELRDTYATMGSWDFLILWEAADHDTAFQAVLTIERHGLDLQTMEVTPTEKFADLVDDQ